MSITSIRKTKMAHKGGPGAVGVRFDPTDRQLKIHDGVTELVVPTHGRTPVSKTAAYTVVFPADHGKILKVALAASLVVTLPAISSANAGMRITVVNTLLPTSGVGYSISPAAADSIAYGVDNKDLINTAATDALGDMVTLQSDGVDTWIVVAQTGIWAKE